MKIQVISKSIGIHMRCDNQTVTTSVMVYGIRIQNGVDWQKIRELIADGVEWGKIMGNINSQADLKNKFDDLWKYAKKNRKLAKAAL